MAQSQQKLIVDDDAKLRSLTAAPFEDEQLDMRKRRSRAANRRGKQGADPFRGSREDCEEKVPMAAANAYRAKAWECLSLAECLNDPEERAEIVRFARMWMSLAEPIDEARGSYEFPRGR